MKKLLSRLRNEILPDCFSLESVTVSSESQEKFEVLAENPDSFMKLVRENTSVEDSAPYVDCFDSGFLGALALSLWFMEFDQDNWFSFGDVHRLIDETFTERTRIRERLELRLIKGSYSPMMLDQPVILDWKTGEFWFLFGKLND